MDTLVEKNVSAHYPGDIRQRRIVKRVADAHAFLNKQCDNTWKLHTENWKAGTYAYAGGQWPLCNAAI